MRRFGGHGKHNGPTGLLRLKTAVLGLTLALLCSDAVGQQDVEATEQEGAPPAAAAVRLVRVSLPLTGNADTELIAAVDKLLAELPSDDGRPTLIFEFRAREGQPTGGSRFERALALARYLASEKFSRIRTVAYVPESLEGHHRARRRIWTCGQE
jgi:membrane-bound serine protease (ClpP class)